MEFTILIYGEPGMFDRLDEAAQAEILSKHAALQEALHRDGAYVLSSRLASSATAMKITGPREKPLVTDGPYAETKEHFLGLYQIECADVDKAIAYASMIADETTTLEVRPVAWSQ